MASSHVVSSNHLAISGRPLQFKTNAQMRMKHGDNPERFMDSEVDLATEIKRLFVVASSPELYPELVNVGAVPTILELLRCGHQEGLIPTPGKLQGHRDLLPRAWLVWLRVGSSLFHFQTASHLRASLSSRRLIGMIPRPALYPSACSVWPKASGQGCGADQACRFKRPALPENYRGRL